MCRESKNRLIGGLGKDIQRPGDIEIRFVTVIVTSKVRMMRKRRKWYTYRVDGRENGTDIRTSIS